MLRTILAALVGLTLTVGAQAQSVPLQGGPWEAGHAPMYSNSGNSQPVIQDSGPAGGGAVGLGMSEGLYVARGTGTPPYAGQGTGPSGTNWCDYDAPITNATGYHVLCLSPNVGGRGMIYYNAGGGAAQLPLTMRLNGTDYDFPFILSGVIGPPTTTVGHLATWGNTTGTLLSDTANLPCADMPALTGTVTTTLGSCATSPGTGNITWPGDQYFGSGRPWCDVRAKGALGNGSTDDSAAFASCVTTLTALGGGDLFVPAGSYCVNSGVTTTTQHINFVGIGYPTSVMRICDGSDTSVITINRTFSGVYSIFVVGLNSSIATVPAVSVGTSCIECRVFNSYIQGGANALRVSGGDSIVFGNHFDVAFGTAQVQLNSAGAIYMIRNKTDQSFVNGQPAYPLTVGSWASTDATKCTVTASIGSIISLNGYYLQCLTAGTTGSVAPALPYAYGTNITDGSAVWRLSNPATYSAVLMTGQVEAYLWGGDYTGPFTSGIRLNSTTNYTTIESATTGGFLYGIEADSGSRLFVSSTTVGGCITLQCQGINVEGTFTGRVILSGNYIENVYAGVQLNTGTTTAIISGNEIHSSGYGVLVQPNVNDMNITNNAIYSLNDITVAAGTSDYYVITGNIGHGIVIADGGTGVNKTIASNW